MDEHRLWQAWRKARDERAFEALVGPHLAFAVDLARRLGCGPHDADDLVQQALARLSRARGDRPVEVGVRAWLGRRVSLGARTLRRARARRARHEARAPASRPRAAVATVEARDQVEAALAALEPREREAVVLRFLHDLEYREAAYVLGISPVACRLRVHRALNKLRARLGKGATALLAACALLTGARPAHALAPVACGGVLLMGKSLKIAVAVAVLLLVAWLAWPERSDTPERATRHAASPVADAGRETGAPATTDTTAEPEPAPPPENDGSVATESAWQEYDSMRALGRMNKRMRGLHERMRGLGAAEGREPEVQADPTTLVYLEELRARFRALPAGAERRKVFESFVNAHGRYVRATHDVSFLPFLDEVVRTGDPAERVLALVRLHRLSLPRVVDFLIRALSSDDPAVRRAAVANLGAVEGAEAPRAHDALLAGLADDAPVVRWTTALQIEFEMGRREHATPLLARLPDETDPVAMHGLVHAVLAVDPEDGRPRVEAALADAPAGARTLGLKALERKSEGGFAPRVRVPAVPAAPKAAPVPPPTDESTRAYLERLVAELRVQAPGPARLQRVKTFVRTHRTYLTRTRDDSLLPVLDGLLDGATDDERRAIVNSLTMISRDPVVTGMIAWAKSPHASVRAAAGRVLAGVHGDRADEARAALLALLEDEDRNVRRQVAVVVGGLRDAPEAVPALLDRLRRETDFATAYGLARAVTRLDPEKGAEKLRKVPTDAPDSAQKAIERVLRR